MTSADPAIANLVPLGQFLGVPFELSHAEQLSPKRLLIARGLTFSVQRTQAHARPAAQRTVYGVICRFEALMDWFGLGHASLSFLACAMRRDGVGRKEAAYDEQRQRQPVVGRYGAEDHSPCEWPGRDDHQEPDFPRDPPAALTPVGVVPGRIAPRSHKIPRKDCQCNRCKHGRDLMGG